MKKEFITPEECRALFAKIVSMTTGGGKTNVSLINRWNNTARWARSRIQVMADVRSMDLKVTRSIKGIEGSATTTRIDEAGLLEVIRSAERSIEYSPSEDPEKVVEGDIEEPLIDEPVLSPNLWSEETYNLKAGGASELARELIEPAQSAGLLTAGSLEVGAAGHATMLSNGLFRYYPVTDVQCSITVRDLKGTASGWAGINHHDLARINPRAINATAIDKCKRMANPVAVEPGRYTVILEPQAVNDLFCPVLSKQTSHCGTNHVLDTCCADCSTFCCSKTQFIGTGI